MRRRGFLTGLAGILAAGAAPALVREPMKIWVPKKDIQLVTWDHVYEPGLFPPSHHLTDLSADFDGDTVPYNVGKVYQDEFGEAFFPTMAVNPIDPNSELGQLVAKVERRQRKYNEETLVASIRAIKGYRAPPMRMGRRLA